MAEQAVTLRELEIVAEGLGELLNEVVFVGGATVPFYLDKPEEEELRMTEDVDVVVKVTSYLQYAKLEAALAKKGFNPDPTSNVAVRKQYRGILVDVIPSEDSVWGFSNKWYPKGITQSIRVELPLGKKIRIFSLPYFLASKFEAYQNRALNIDMSQDLEDILLVFHGNNSLKSHLIGREKELLEYLAGQVQKLLQLGELDFRQLCDAYRVSNNRVREACKLVSSCYLHTLSPQLQRNTL